jgi:hypothetical protein
MPRFFFDTRDGDAFLKDDEGVLLPDLEAARDQAAVSLAELAREVIPGSARRELAVEVSDDRGPVLKALLHFEAVVLAT